MVTDPSIRKWTRTDHHGPGSSLEKMLGEFLEMIIQGGCCGAFSTIRCEEFHPGMAVQTLLSINSEGKLEKTEREVDIETRLARPEFAFGSFRKAIVPVLLLSLVGGVISIFFVDYPKLFADARDQVVPLTKEEVTLDLSKLENVLVVEVTEVDRKQSALILKVTRGPGWEKAFSSLPSDSMKTWPTFLLHEAIHRGRLNYDLFGKEQKLLASGAFRLEDLLKKEEIEVTIPAKVSERLVEVSFYP